jgi:hypothetical protein
MGMAWWWLPLSLSELGPLLLDFNCIENGSDETSDPFVFGPHRTVPSEAIAANCFVPTHLVCARSKVASIR